LPPIAKSPIVKPVEPTPVAQPVEVVLHVVADGFTASGRVWFASDEIVYTVGSRAEKGTKDRRGFSWLSLVTKPDEQIRRYGKVYLKPGPYTGKLYVDMTNSELVAARVTGNPRAPISPETAAFADANRRIPLPELR
jgi:hypothetical protein